MVRTTLSVLLLGLLAVGCASTADENAATGDEQAVTSGAGPAIAKVTYSDLGNVINVSGTAVMFEGEATLFMKNDSHARVNHALALTAMSGIGYSIVRGDNGLSHYDTQFDTGDLSAPTIPNDGDCVGLYSPQPSGETKNVGAFKYCRDRLDGVQRCQTELFPTSDACLAETRHLSVVGYPNDTTVSVSGQASYFENQARIMLRNETMPDANGTLEAVSPEEKGIAIATVEGGGNGMHAFDTNLALRSVADGDCLGLYEISEATGRRVNVGAFKFLPHRPQQFYYDAAECLADK